MIQLTNVSKRFETKDGTITAVDHVDLTIERGEIFGIIGYSGAGKSTMIRLLNGLEQPTEGEVTVNGKRFSHMSGADMRAARQKVSMIFQHFNLLWSRTVAENIAFPLEIAGVSKADRTRRVQELVELVGLKGRENAYPSQLSGGQKQRVGIARALANEPDVLLGDEATSALDPETTDSILDLLVDINERLGTGVMSSLGTRSSRGTSSDFGWFMTYLLRRVFLRYRSRNVFIQIVVIHAFIFSTVLILCSYRTTFTHTSCIKSSASSLFRVNFKQR